MSTGTTWYVIADGGKARIVALEGAHLRTLQHFDNSGHGDTDEDASAGTSQLKAPRTDPHDQAKAHFAKQVASRINEAVRTGRVDEIMLAAPAHVLHDIRAALGKAAVNKLGPTLSKDLANTPDHELASHFSAGLNQRPPPGELPLAPWRDGHSARVQDAFRAGETADEIGEGKRQELPGGRLWRHQLVVGSHRRAGARTRETHAVLANVAAFKVEALTHYSIGVQCHDRNPCWQLLRRVREGCPHLLL